MNLALSSKNASKNSINHLHRVVKKGRIQVCAVMSFFNNLLRSMCATL